MAEGRIVAAEFLQRLSDVKTLSAVASLDAASAHWAEKRCIFLFQNWQRLRRRPRRVE